jgi:hypothetical protein
MPDDEIFKAPMGFFLHLGRHSIFENTHGLLKPCKHISNYYAKMRRALWIAVVLLA